MLRCSELFVSLYKNLECGGAQFYVITTMKAFVRSFFCINDNKIHTHRLAYEWMCACVWMFEYTISLFMNYDPLNDSFGIFGFISTLFSNFSVWTIIINICFILWPSLVFSVQCSALKYKKRNNRKIEKKKNRHTKTEDKAKAKAEKKKLFAYIMSLLNSSEFMAFILNSEHWTLKEQHVLESNHWFNENTSCP